MAKALKSKRPTKEAPLPAIPTSDSEIYENPALEITYVKIMKDLDKPVAAHSSKAPSKRLKKIVLSFVILALCVLCCVLLAIYLKQARNSTCAANDLQGRNSTSTDLQKQNSNNVTIEKKRKGRNSTSTALQKQNLTSLTCKEKGKGNNGLVFFGDDIQEYGLSPGISKSLSSISACAWLKIPSYYVKNHDPTVLSYATTSFSNEFIIWIKSNIYVVRANSYHARAPINVSNIADNKFHHLCVTWELSNGPVKMYVDGVSIFNTSIPTVNIAAGGTWVIGQDQDKVGGGFQAKDSMKGVLAEVNVWDRILSPKEIAGLALSCCPTMKGNVKAHDDFELQGEVLTFKPKCCLN